MGHPAGRSPPGDPPWRATSSHYFSRVTAARQSLNPFRVLISHRNFRNFWVGQTLSLVGTWMQQMAQGWLALELSNSAFVVGLVVAIGSLPILLFSLHAGVLVDRSDKLRLVKRTQSLLLVGAVVLWWMTWSGRITVPWLCALALFSGAVSSVEIPARQSLMIDLVGRDDLRDAIALNSSGFNLARIVGPAVAAVIIARFGIAWCFGANAISFLTVLIGLSRVTLPPWQPRVTGSPLQEIRSGLSYLLRERRVRGLLEVVTVFSILGVPYIALMPVVARDQLHLGAGGYGLLLSVLGLGGLSGALALAAAGQRLRRGRVLAQSFVVYAILLMLFAASRTAAVAAPVLFATGFLMIVNNALANGLLQTLVHDDFRGRLMAVYSLIVVGLPQALGAFAAGAVAGVVGVSWAVGGAAGAMLLFGLYAFRRYPGMREL